MSFGGKHAIGLGRNPPAFPAPVPSSHPGACSRNPVLTARYPCNAEEATNPASDHNVGGGICAARINMPQSPRLLRSLSLLISVSYQIILVHGFLLPWRNLKLNLKMSTSTLRPMTTKMIQLLEGRVLQVRRHQSTQVSGNIERRMGGRIMRIK